MRTYALRTIKSERKYTFNLRSRVQYFSGSHTFSLTATSKIGCLPESSLQSETKIEPELRLMYVLNYTYGYVMLLTAQICYEHNIMITSKDKP